MSEQGDETRRFFGYVIQAKSDIDSSVERAKSLGRLAELKTLLREAFHALHANPTTWGDPLHNTRLLDAEGSPLGTVYYRIYGFLVLRYVYFADQNKGLLLRVLALPDHPLGRQA